jgi:hypothetical protein
VLAESKVRVGRHGRCKWNLEQAGSALGASTLKAPGPWR